MTDAVKIMNPEHFRSNSADIWIRINSEIWIQISDHVLLTFWPWQSLHSLSAKLCVCFV